MQQNENSFTVKSPALHYIKFTRNLPRYFEVRDSVGRIYYFRHLNNIPRIKFNILEPDTYTTNVPIEVIKTGPVEIPKTFPELPPPERDRYKETTIVYNPNFNGPVRIFTNEGIVETGPSFYDLPPVLRLFLLLHEQGHYFYKTEEYCDLYALVNYLRMGYNRSMAYYCLTDILTRTPENIARVNQMFNNIQQTQTTPLL